MTEKPVAEKPIHRWIAAHDLMSDEFRTEVVTEALNHYQMAPADLRKFALETLKKVQVNGFRPFPNIRLNKFIPKITSELKNNDAVATVVVCLWTDKHAELIEILKQAALEASIPVHKNWTWLEGSQGFLDSSDMPELSELIDTLAKQTPDREHYLLAALWLSTGLCREEMQEQPGESRNIAAQAVAALMNPCIEPDDHKALKKSRTADPKPEISESAPMSLDTAELDRKSIKGLSDYWNSQSDEIMGARDSFLSKIEELRSAALNEGPDQASEKLRQLEVHRQGWERLSRQSEEIVDYIQGRIARELRHRPDIKDVQPEVRDLSENPTEGELVALLPAIFQAISKYDEKKTALQWNLVTLRNELLILEQSLSLWQNDIAPVRHQLQELNDVQDLSLQRLQAVWENAKKVVQDAKQRRLQARGISISRIVDTIKRLGEFPNEKGLRIGKCELSQINEAILQDLPGRELQEIERDVLTLFNQMVEKARRGNSRKIAAQLQRDWSETNLEHLLEQLASEKKDLEAVLVEIASNAVHPRVAPALYSREITKSLFCGLSELSTYTNPYLLLNQLATQFFLGWKADDPASRYERCILALAAQASNQTGLPHGFLWQIESDWPEPSLPTWGRLWQAVLLEEEAHIYTDQKLVEMQAELDTKQRNIESLLSKDGAHYIRLTGVKSDRHRAMLTAHVMPHFQDHYAHLDALRKQFGSTSVEKHPRFLAELQKIMETLEKAFTEKRLEELYEKGAYEENIIDAQQFHAKICMRIMVEYSDALMEYGKAMMDLETLRVVRRDGLNYQNLAEELAGAADASLLVQPALDQIVKGSFKSRKERNEEDETLQGIEKIIAKLLTDTSCVHRFPQAIGLMVNEPFSWNGFLHSLLADLESPNDIRSAATQRLAKNAPSQVLLVVQQVPLDIQKLAQSVQRDQEKLISDLEVEYIKLGGDSEWIKIDHEIGRWGYLSRRLTEEIKVLKRRSEVEHQIFENQSFAFRERINKLDMDIFRSKASIPVEVFRILQYGLSVARKASEVAQLFPTLKDYLDEAEYRLSRESWLETEVENATEDLEKQLAGTVTEENMTLNAQQILDAFNLGNLAKLGLDPEEFEESKISTRVNLLDNWLAIKNHRSMLSEKLNRTELNRISALFSYFARMHQMQRSVAADGSYMSFENPVVHEYWLLRYPRTPALSKQCVMITLPGDPPKADTLQFLDGLLEKENFLAAHFVFLFVPGCTDKIARRLNQNYAKQGLVLVDETALIKMVLAERESGMVPLGKLRPLMLNSTGANADIFTVNQSVNSRTSIFYGRDTLIERIASSGDNYAIYGGRRIGKSSILKALEQLLEFRNHRVVSYSLEGDIEYSEEYISKRLAGLIGIQQEYEQSKDFKNTLFSYFESHPDESIVLILDEIDRYISENPERHTLIEALRATSDRFEDRFRVIIAGFMELYDCLSGRGPYTPTSDPWGRMLNNMGPLENLKPSDAEKIVQEGFRSILGWNFEHRAIPRRIVERTGGHPAFVQYFCLKLQEQVSKRGDQLVTLKDIDTVFDDNTPEKSFIWFVRKTLEMNLSDPTYKRRPGQQSVSDPVSRYLLLWLALDSSTSKSFTLDQIREIANLSKVPISEKILLRSLELLTVTSVVREKSSQLYEFTVPDYPMILNRLGEGSELEVLEQQLKAFLDGQKT